MTATITVNEAGQIMLPESVMSVFGLQPGARLRAEATADRIEIVKDMPVVAEGMIENGVLLLPRLGMALDAAAAVNADRESQVGRALEQ